MSRQRWRRVESFFDRALGQPSGLRSAWLSDACREDPEIRREVERLLAAHERAQGVLERPIESLASDLLAESAGPSLKDRMMGPYRLLREIGRGGMGVVYQAYDPRLDRFVALKLLPFHLQDDEQIQNRFIAEAKAASALDHPNICTIYDVGESEDGRLYIAMAYYQGQTLDQRIAEGPLPFEEARDIAIQIAKGLGRAHEAGIIHRDIKPSNIALTTRCEVKILDFGVAKLERRGGLTDPGMRIGTVAYMSPEQARGDQLDQRTDLWSLGVILYEMLTGRRPFVGSSDILVGQAILHEEPEPVIALRSGLPRELGRVMERVLAKSPRQRYSSAEELLEDLTALAPRVSERSAGPARETGNLPVLLTSFVGREQECRSIKALISRVRFLTLTGPAGTGKTRLAVQVAREASADFADGVFFVPLASIVDPDAVPSAIAQNLGWIETGTERPLDMLKRALRSKQALLVLDNFERVSGAVSAMGELLEACPELKVLVTSRVALRWSGEHEFPVSPLELPGLDGAIGADSIQEYSAVRLFVDRARAVVPELSVTDDSAPSIAEICVRLDGLPLAIELAAARTKLFTPQSMLKRLERRLDLLKGGHRDRPARHQTLRHAIAWSYDLLEEEQKAFFRRVSLFVSGFSLEAANAVALEGVDVIDGVEALVDHSLLRRRESPDGEVRFVMLETVREFALEQLAKLGEADAVARAHTQHFLALGERAEPELTGPEQAVWLDRLDRDRDNLSAALRWAEERGEGDIGLRLGAALWRFWLVRGYSREGRRRLERILDQPQAKFGTRERARALHGIGTLAHNMGDNEKARSLLEEALSIWRELGDKEGMANGLNNLGWVACELNDLAKGQSLSEEGLALNRELGQKRGMAVALNNLGWLAHYRGEYDAARRFHEESLALRREIGDRRGIAFALSNLAWAEGYHGSYGKALELLEEPLAIIRSVQDNVLLGWALNVAAMVTYDRGDYERAAGHCEECISLWEEGGNRSLLAWALTTLGAIVNDQNEPERARGLLDRGLAIWREIGTLWGIAMALHRLGNVALAETSFERARALYRESLMLRRDIGDRRGIAEVFESMARLYAAEGAVDSAVRLLASARILRDELGVPLPQSQLENQLTLHETLRAETPRFERLWKEGAAMPLDQGLALCLEP